MRQDGVMSEEVLLEVIDALVGGLIDIPELQGRLAAGASALDDTYSALVDVLHEVDNDLERIQFTMLQSKQVPAVIFRLEAARDPIDVLLQAQGEP
jgi:hypothetical protein